MLTQQVLTELKMNSYVHSIYKLSLLQNKIDIHMQNGNLHIVHLHIHETKPHF